MADCQEPRSLPTQQCCEGAPEAMDFRRHAPFNRRDFLKLVALSGVGLLAQDGHGPTSRARCDLWAEADTILRRIKPPSFPAECLLTSRCGVGAGRRLMVLPRGRPPLVQRA